MHPQSTFRSNGIIFLSKVPPFAAGLLNTSHASLLFEKLFSSVTLPSCELQRESRWCLPWSTPGQPYPFYRCCSNEHLDKLISRGHHYGHACAHAWWYWDFSSYLEMNLSELTSLMSNYGCPCTFTLKMEMLHSCSHCQGFLSTGTAICLWRTHTSVVISFHTLFSHQTHTQSKSTNICVQ